MKKILSIALCGFFFFSQCGCVSVSKRKVRKERKVKLSTAQQPFALYSGPKARIRILALEVKAPKANPEIAQSMQEMLVGLLEESTRFEIALSQEPDREETLREGKPQVAEVILEVQLSEFEPQSSGGRAGIGGGGGIGSGALGTLLGGALNKAHVALELRLIDASSSEVLKSSRIQGQASDISANVAGGPLDSRKLGVYANTPMEKAIRLCVVEAVRYVCDSLPATYYQY